MSVFDNTRAYWRFLDHCGELEHIHIDHSAGRMARFQIAAKQCVLLFGGPRRCRASFKMSIAAQGAFLAFAKREF